MATHLSILKNPMDRGVWRVTVHGVTKNRIQLNDGEGNGNPLQCSCLENPMDGGAWCPNPQHSYYPGNLVCRLMIWKGWDLILCPSAIRVVSSAYLRLLIFLPAILIPACASSSQAFRIMYSAYKLNKQGDNIQP